MDMRDEVEEFHTKREREKLRLVGVDSDDGSDDSGSDDPEAVLGISSDEDSEDFSDDSDDEYRAKLIKQEKALRKATAKTSDSEDEEEDDKAGQDGAWGSKKRAYYDADIADVEGSDDEEDMENEGIEAQRLQREAAAAMHTDDFLDDDDNDDDESSSDEDDGDDKKSGKKKIKAWEREDKARAPQAHEILEAVALLDELQSSLSQANGLVGRALEEVNGNGLATSEGVSYLEAKHSLLLHYAAGIAFYLLLKAEGRPVRNHPVLARLVELRAYIEKLRPIDKKLQYQIDKLLAAADKAQAAPATQAAAAEQQGGEDGLHFAPRPEALLRMADQKQQRQQVEEDDYEGGLGGGANKQGVYQPPRNNPMSMETEGLSARDKRKALQKKRAAANSSFLHELALEVADAPEEYRAGGPIGMDTAAALRERQKLAAREAVEEELMVRVPLTKEERKRMKAHQRAGLSGKSLLDDFADDLADILDPAAAAARTGEEFGKHRLSQKYGADLFNAEKKRAGHSGDADLPERESLTARRAKMDGVVAYGAGFGDGMKKSSKRDRVGEDDETYLAAKGQRDENRKKRAKETTTLPPAEDPTTMAARKINTAIEKNRGLTPHRRKDIKNPRKKNRIKFAAANVRRHGQVQEKKSAAGTYGGESTGIKSMVTKSTKF